MLSPTYQDTIQSLIPSLSDNEKKEIKAYYAAFEKHEAEIAEEATKELMDHPIFGPLIKAIPKEVSEERSKISRELQKDAIFNDNWMPYVSYQMEQGITYAKMGFSFTSWYEIVSLARKYLVPCLAKEYGDGEQFLKAWSGMNKMMDIGMAIIGEAYVQEKQELIQEEQQKIIQLNQELEQKVADRTAELATINKELEAFSYSVSHDLRAPLRAINGFARILNEDFASKLDKDGMNSLNAIMRNSQKMGTLIDDLLEFSRLGRLKVSSAKIDMDELVKQVIEEETLGNTSNIDFQLGKLSPAMGGQVLIKQVWANLISNAIKYSADKSRIKIEIGSYSENGHIVYFVKDNGVGFDMKYYDKLFGVFQRLHSQEEFDGTGIGLAIVKRIVHHHNGDVWAESKLNEGTCFSFSLPAASA